MIKEERDRLFAQNGWSKNDVRLLLKYIEELEASRGSRTLSAVPSAKEIDKMANELYEKDEITDRLSFVFGAEWTIEKFKRGIVG